MSPFDEVSRLRAILALGRELTGEHDLESLCNRVIVACLEHTAAERAAVVIFDPGSMAPLVSVTRATDGAPFTLATTALGLRIDSPEPVHQTEIENDPTVARGASVRSVIVMPLRLRGRHLGAIAIDARAVHRTLSTPDLAWLEDIGVPTSLAVANALAARQVASVVGDEWRRLERVVRDLPLGIVVLDERHRCVLVNRWARTRSTELGQLAAGTPVATIANIPCENLVGIDSRIATTTDEDRILTIASHTLADRETVIVIADVTEECERQAQAAHRDRLTMVGQLAGGVAHDFNNLLHVILTYASLLEESAIDAAQRDDAHQISHAAASAADLTRQLLTFSRRDLIKPKVVDIPHAIYAMEKLLRRTVGPEIDLTIAIGQHVPHVLIDRSQLEQIILNLVVNARDATPTRGVISISIEGLDLDPVTAARRGITAGHYAQIEIADTGTGIPSELIGRIFEPYFNIKETGKGGLGLATVHGVIQQAAGDIVVASEVGRGTTFRILLPATDQRGEQPAWKGGTSSSHATILLVDDDDNVRRATERILRSAGYSVLSANSGHNAIAFAREHAGGIDLLLTDMTMPGMSGRELAGQVRSIGTIERVLFMSGYHSEGALSEAELIIKPFQRVDLLEKVRAVLAECFSPAQLASTMR